MRPAAQSYNSSYVHLLTQLTGLTSLALLGEDCVLLRTPELPPSLRRLAMPLDVGPRRGLGSDLAGLTVRRGAGLSLQCLSAPLSPRARGALHLKGLEVVERQLGGCWPVEWPTVPCLMSDEPPPAEPARAAADHHLGCGTQ